MGVVTAASITGSERARLTNKTEKLLDLAADYIERRDAMMDRRGREARRQERRLADNAMYAIAVAQVYATLAAEA